MHVLVKVFAAFGAQPQAILAADGLDGLVKQKNLARQRGEVKQRIFRDSQLRIGGFVGRISEQLVNQRLEPLREIRQAAHTFQLERGSKAALNINALPGAREAQ